MNFKQKNFTSCAGNTFTFQFPGIRTATQIRDRVKNKFGVPQEEKIAEEMLKTVIVEPKMKMEDFSSMKEYDEVVGAAYKFANGMDDDDDNLQEGSSK